MLPPEEAAQQQEKYHDASGIITDEMLFEQLVGGQSIASLGQNLLDATVRDEPHKGHQNV